MSAGTFNITKKEFQGKGRYGNCANLSLEIWSLIWVSGICACLVILKREQTDVRFDNCNHMVKEPRHESYYQPYGF